MKIMRYNDISESANKDFLGGISMSDYDEVIGFVTKLKEKSKKESISDEDKILSEILYRITKEKDKLDFKTYYLRRLSEIKNNTYRTRKHGIETEQFRDLVWWLQGIYEWSFVEPEGSDRVRFDWNESKYSLWLNDNLTIDGYIPEELRHTLEEKGIKIHNK
jgi:hypothetical protein